MKNDISDPTQTSNPAGEKPATISEADFATIPGVPGGSRNATASLMGKVLTLVGFAMLILFAPLSIQHFFDSPETFCVSGGSCFVLYTGDLVKVFAYIGMIFALFVTGVWLIAVGSPPHICAVCNHRIVSMTSRSRSKNSFSTKLTLRRADGTIRQTIQFFHNYCYREILRGQRRRCLNCDVPLYNPGGRDLVSLPVVLDKKHQLFCSLKCLITYKPLAGLAVTMPIEVTCPYCKSIYSSSLTQCPTCGAARRKESLSLMSLDPRAFEQKVAQLLMRMGYANVTRVGGSGDRAADVIAQRKDEFGRMLRYIVQCKTYDSSSRMGSKEMQVFCSMMDNVHRADRGIYVTTSSFTPEAVEIARKFNVTLVDGKLLQELLTEYA